MRGLGLIAISVAAASCDAGAKKPDCRAAVAALARAEPDIPLADEQLGALRDAITARCREDKWTPQAIECLARSRDTSDERDCRYKYLTQENSDKLLEAMGPWRRTDAQRALAKMSEFRDTMCACKDAKCAQGVADEMSRWSQETARSNGDAIRMTEEDTRQAGDIGTAIASCMQAAMDTPATPTDRDEATRAMAKMASFKDRMCACKSAACASAVADDMTAWSQEEVKSQKKAPRLSDDDIEKAAAIGEEMGRCMHAAMSR